MFRSLNFFFCWLDDDLSLTKHFRVLETSKQLTQARSCSAILLIKVLDVN